MTVPRLSEAELAAIRRAYLETTAAAAEGDVPAYGEAHRRFHFGLFVHAGARLERQVEDLWDHAERYRRLHLEHAGRARTRRASRPARPRGDPGGAQGADAGLAARRTAEHLARTALVTLAHTDQRHEPARVRAALEHVYAEDPTARDERRAAAS